jgi:Domain of unknown function (DUF4404)
MPAHPTKTPEHPMTDDSVRELLSKMHDTLSGATPPMTSEEDRRLLAQLSADIQAILARPGAAAERGPQTIAEQLQAAVTRFEVTHPDLTATMARAAKTLGDMGI